MIGALLVENETRLTRERKFSLNKIDLFLRDIPKWQMWSIIKRWVEYLAWSIIQFLYYGLLIDRLAEFTHTLGR